jgi:hypothetical protein
MNNFFLLVFFSKDEEEDVALTWDGFFRQLVRMSIIVLNKSMTTNTT